MSPDVETCFREQRARVYRWAHALTGRHEDALDVVQEVFMRLIQRPALRLPPAATMAWLRRATARIVIDRWRAARSRAALERAHTAPDVAAETPEARELAGHIRSALKKLSEHQRLVVMAKCYDGMKFQQIADELGVAVPTVKTHYLRALAALRERLRPYAEAGSHP